MTAQEMIIGVNIGVQKVDSNAYDNLLDEESLYYLNKAQREYVRRQTIYLKEEMERVSRQDFITGNEASENLRTLLTNESISTFTASDYSNAQIADITSISNNIFGYVHSIVTYNTDKKRPGKLISNNDIHLYEGSAYNDPIFRRFPIMFNNTDLYVFYDYSLSTLDNIVFNYIRVPKNLVLTTPTADEVTTCELPLHTHDEIVNLAVAMILEDFKSVRPYEQNQTTLKGE